MASNQLQARERLQRGAMVRYLLLRTARDLCRLLVPDRYAAYVQQSTEQLALLQRPQARAQCAHLELAGQ